MQFIFFCMQKILQANVENSVTFLVTKKGTKEWLCWSFASWLSTFVFAFLNLFFRDAEMKSWGGGVHVKNESSQCLRLNFFSPMGH